MESTTKTNTPNPADISAGDLPVTPNLLNIKGARQSRPWVGRICIALFSFVLMLGFVAAALFVMLIRGPLEIPFLSARVESALEQRIGGGIDVSVGRTVLEKTERGLELHIYDVSLKNAQGRDIVRAPDALVTFDVSQFLRLSIVPRRLALRGVQVRAEITQSGEIVLSTDSKSTQKQSAENSTTVPQSPSARLTDAIAAMAGLAKAGVVTDGSGAVFDTLSIDDSSLIVEDRRNGKRLNFDRFTMAFDSQQSGLAQIKGSIAKDNEVMPFNLTAQPAGDDFQFTIQISNIGDAVLHAALGLEALPFKFDAALSAKLIFTTNSEGKAKAAVAQIDVSPGSISLPSLANEPFAFDQGQIRAEWKGDPTKIDDLTFLIANASPQGNYQISASGPVAFPTEANPWFQFNGRGSNWKLTPLSASENSVSVENAQVKLAIHQNLDVFKVENFTVSGPTTDISLSGILSKDADGPALKLDISANRMLARSALRWWPAFVAPIARTHLVRTIQDGYLTRMKLALNFPPPIFKIALENGYLPAEALQLDGAIDGVSATIIEGAPPLSGLAASGRVNTVSVQGTASTAYIDVRAGKRIQLSDGVISLTGFDMPIPQTRIAFRNQGALDTIAEFLKTPALKGGFAVDIDPATIKGQFDGRSTMSFPLIANLKTSDLTPEFSATMTNVTLDKAIGRDKLENATLNLSGDKTGVEVKGEGRWQGQPVAISFESDANDKSLAAVLSFTLDDAALKRRGINLGSQLSGTLPVKVRTTKVSDEALKAFVEVDLTRASTDGLIPGFQKPAGRAGKLTFEAIEKPAGYSIQNLVLESGASSFRGQAEILADGTITSAKFNQFRLSPGDTVRLDYERQGNGGKATIRGNNFDARPFLKAASQSGGAGNTTERDIDLDLKTTLLSGYGGEVITNADIRLVRRAGQLRQFTLAGKLDGRIVTVSGRSTSETAAPLTIEADDAGAFLRFLDIYTRMSGGDLSGQILPSGKRMGGYFIARNFILRNEPALKRLTQQSTTDGATASNDSLSKFTKMRVDFNKDGNEITIKDAVIFGPQIGITFNGVFDQVRDRISLSGTFVPAYGLNNAFAQIPVLGNILAGGRNEGVLAITFGVSGRASQPNVTVNPLSAVAPGIFRKIFEFRNDSNRSNQTLPQQLPN